MASKKPEKVTSPLITLNNIKNTKRLITEEEITVIAVRPTETDTAVLRYNTIVEIDVKKDKGKIEKRFVKVKRVHLKEAFEHAGFSLNSDGSYSVPAAADESTLLESLKAQINIDQNEVEIRKDQKGYLAIRALPTSLGFIGTVSLTDQSV